MAEMTVLICPKCQGAMRTYERSGVVIDQCTDCRGIFLDHGELERLMDAERMATGGRRDEFREARDSDRESEPARSRDQHEHVPDVGDDDWRGRDSRGRPVGGERRRESRFGGILDIFGGD